MKLFFFETVAGGWIRSMLSHHMPNSVIQLILVNNFCISGMFPLQVEMYHLLLDELHVP